jgi:TRAP-type C4-dicarboxylate transport system substrate-binding protein
MGNKLTLLIIIVAILATTLVAFAQVSCAPKQGELIELTLVSAYPPTDLWQEYCNKYIDRINNENAGQLKITMVGGPEVVSPFQTLEPVSQGVYDFGFTAAPYTTRQVTAAKASAVSKASITELRKSGLYDVLDKAYREKLGVTWIGPLVAGGSRTMFTTKKVSRLDDIEGLRIRCHEGGQQEILAFGGSPMVIAIPETYGALEKGIVDGVTFPVDPTIREQGWYKFCKYMIIPTWPDQQCSALYMNAAKFDSLPSQLQKSIRGTVIDMEKEVYEYYDGLASAEIDELVKLGVNKVQLPREDAIKWLNDYGEIVNDWILENCPEYGEELVKIITPFGERYVEEVTKDL